MTEPQEIWAGQIWDEKKQRKEYTSKRTLKVMSLGEEAFSHQPGKAEVTSVHFAIRISRQRAFWGPGDGLWELSKRTMYAFGLRKNWRLIKDAPYVLCLTCEPAARCYGPTELDARASFDRHVYEEHMTDAEREQIDDAWENNGRDIPPEEFMPVDLDDEREMRL